MGDGHIRNAWYVAAWHHELEGGAAFDRAPLMARRVAERLAAQEAARQSRSIAAE